MPRVLNKRIHGVHADAVYVGRPTKFGNPYSHIANGTLAKFTVSSRDEAVDAYENALLRKFERDPDAKRRLQEALRGKDLVCWCAPQRCHADVLLKYANEEESG